MLDLILERAELAARTRFLERDEGGEIGGADVTPPPPKIDAAFTKLLDLLKKEGELLRFSSQEREIQSGLLKAEKKLKRELTTVERALVETQLRSNQALADETALLDDIRGPTRAAARALAALNRLREDGALKAEEFRNKERELLLARLKGARDLEGGVTRGLLRIEEEFGNVADVAEDTLVGAFKAAEDALVEFVNTGKFEFRSLVDSIAADITRLAIRAELTAPLAKFIGSKSDSGGFISSLLSGVGSLFSGGGFNPASLADGISNFSHGGNFQIGGAAGIDRNVLSVNNKPVARVSKGETVSVSPSGSNDRPIQINYNISTPDANSFQRSQDQILSRTQGALRRASRRNS